jgi:tRNA(Met) C34 N-acetyltransferase TmcA
MATIKDDIRFAVDPVAFAEEVLPRIDPDIEKLDSWQEEFLKTRSRRMLVNAFRQSGKCSLTGILALHRALYYPRSLVLILAPSLRQAGEFFEKVSTGFAELSGGGLAIEAESDRKLGIKLTNGSRVEALPGTQKSTRGFSKPSLIIIDEAAQIDDALYTGVMPMLTRAKEGDDCCC